MSILSPLKSLIHRLGMLYVRTVCAREYNNQTITGINERPIEFAFLFRQLVAFWPKNILDVGTGATSLPHVMRNCGFMVTSTDNIKDYWPSGMINRHYHVINDDITCTKLKFTYDAITCISVLEHIKNHREAMQTLYKLLNPGGRLILTFPYSEEQYVPNVYALPESAVREKFPFVTQAFSRREIEIWMQDNPFKVVEQEYWQFCAGKFWTCGERVIPPQRVEMQERHQLTCLLLKKPGSQ
jgi:SAM-dependent methyltransferase